ncbi:hypothetical protein [Maribacter sp. 2307ULW6-5]|uniref:hypothetical protein n=1 Tax=Maribacter sp. 2307ULW6-5 TaxID=3386275 RepID=UPI0039BD2314
MKRMAIRQTLRSMALTGMFLATACKGNNEAPVNVEHTISTRSAGLEVARVFVGADEIQPAENTFVYGQTFYTNFEDMDGWVIEDGDFFPELEVHVVSQQGDTLLVNKNLFGGYGQPQDVPVLHGSLTLAYPFLSNEDYTVHYKLYDAKGGAAFYTEMELSLVPDPRIEIVEDGLTAQEVYLFHERDGKVIGDGNLPVGPPLSMDFQMLEGFTPKGGKMELGMAILVTDASGHKVADVKDALANTSYDLLGPKEVVKSTLTLSKGRIKNPLQWQVRLWDKISGAELTATATVNAE